VHIMISSFLEVVESRILVLQAKPRQGVG